MNMESVLESPVKPVAVAEVPTRKKKIHCKQELIVSSLQKFYAARDDIKEILPMLMGTSDLSLRLVDWFVTNYSKRHNTSYILEGQEFLVYTNYKSQLKAYSKKLFDPFCRRERILFQVPSEEPFLTTVGKLNFFRWAIQKGVLIHLKLHAPVIEADMNKAMKEQTKIRNTTATSTTSTTSTTSLESTESSVTVATAATGSTTSSKSSTRRRAAANKEPIAAKQMQKHIMEIELRFD
jgi:hypothetical protein